ncbi:MAG: protein translocase subunit SecF [Chloroflexi bacterium]|nr:protein translocase subunit SecF [Chloroflexota bacterium]
MGLQFSIDYTGGTIWEVHFAEGVPQTSDVRAVLVEQGLPDSSVAITTAGERQYVLIRTEEIGLQEQAPATPPPTAGPSGSPGGSGSPDASASPDPSALPDPSASPGPSESPGASAEPSPSSSPGAIVPTEGELGALAAALEERFGPIDEVRQESSVGPVISQEVVTGAILLIVLGSIGILLWMTFRFGDFRMGTVAIAALVHDVIVVLGIFAILGTLFGLQLDALFVTAMLTVIGFSVHDTIVVFDRVRENRIRHAGEPFAAIVNHSLLQTLGRSVNTSLVVLITLASLLLFGGDAIRSFIFALLIGIVSGTYSSIFNASALLVDWHEWAERRRQKAFMQSRAGG